MNGSNVLWGLLTSDYLLLLIKSSKISLEEGREFLRTPVRTCVLAKKSTCNACMFPALQGCWDFYECMACPVFWTNFLQIAPFSVIGHSIIVINLTLIEFYYRSDIRLWLWQGTCLFVIIIASQPAGAVVPDTNDSLSRLSVCGVCSV